MHGMNPMLAALLRFIESGDETGSGATPNTDTNATPTPGDDGADKAPAGDDKGEDAEEPATGDDDEPLGEPGKKALQAEREARAEAVQRAKDAEKATTTLKNEAKALRADLDAARTEAATAAARADELERELWMYRALAEHPVPEEHRHLVKGDTAEDYMAAAESVARLSGVPGVVRTSGTSGDKKPNVSSLEGGRQMFHDRHSTTSRKD